MGNPVTQALHEAIPALMLDKGGVVPGDSSDPSLNDTVPALLSPGETVEPAPEQVYCGECTIRSLSDQGATQAEIARDTGHSITDIRDVLHAHPTSGAVPQAPSARSMPATATVATGPGPAQRNPYSHEPWLYGNGRVGPLGYGLDGPLGSSGTPSLMGAGSGGFPENSEY